MKKPSSRTKNIKSTSADDEQFVSEIERLTKQAHPLIQEHISELKKEVARLIRVNAKAEVAHFSATEKLKAELEGTKKPSFTINMVPAKNGKPA
jgi:hypothetical protein